MTLSISECMSLKSRIRSDKFEEIWKEAAVANMCTVSANV
jgi:hypothetical protein